LRELRERQGLSQTELAAAAAVSRQSIGAAESRRHFPSVDAALRIAAAPSASVEDVFGPEPVQSQEARVIGEAGPGTPLQVARVGEMRVAIPLGDPSGRGFFWPADAVATDNDMRLLPGAELDGLVVAGCDPALGIAEVLLGGQGRHRLVALYQSTGRALALLAEGLVHGALVHGPEDALPEPPLAVRRWHVSAWQVGVAFAPGLGHPSFEALVDGEVELVQREETAASQAAFQRALAQAGAEQPPGPRASGHLEGARRAAIVRGAAVSMEPAANVFGLGFHPLETHVVELWIDARWQSHGGVGRLVELLRSPRFRDRVAVIGSYELSRAGDERR